MKCFPPRNVLQCFHPVAIYDNFGAIRMTAGGFAPPPIHFIGSKWICDSSSNGFLIMALGFLPTINEMGADSDASQGLQGSKSTFKYLKVPKLPKIPQSTVETPARNESGKCGMTRFRRDDLKEF